MSEKDLMKMFDNLDEKIEMCDYTPQELEQILNKKKTKQPKQDNKFKQNYFDYYDDVKDKSLRKQDW